MKNDGYGIIYKASNPNNNKCYIGQTTKELRKRIREHKWNATNLNSNSYNAKFCKAIRKHGVEYFIWEIIEERIPLLLLDDKEIYYIEFFNAFISGYNSTIGGGGIRGYKASNETKVKLSHALKGRIFSLEHKRKLSIAQKGKRNFYGKHHSMESKTKISIGNKHKTISKETQDRMSAAQKKIQQGENNHFYGKHHTEDTKKRMSEEKSNIYYKITMPDGKIDIINGLKRFCRENGLDIRSMQRVMSGKYKHHKGYKCERL